MPAPVNPFKKALAEGKTVIGCWMGLSDLYAAEMMGTAGFDWLVIDSEHAPNDIRSIRDQLIALSHSDSHPVVRVPIGETWVIKQVLDAGAQTVLVPMVESADQARRLVQACRYPPHGNRGVGYSTARASGFGREADYAATANEQICLLVQVESSAGVAALEEILKVDGVDGVFIGPADLAADMGHLADMMQPNVQKTIMDALTQISASGKAAGILSTREDVTLAALDAGARFVAVAMDIPMLVNTAKATAAKWRKTTG